MIARNLMDNREYEVIDGSTIWADMADEMVIDKGEHWYVLDKRTQQYVMSGYEYMTYEVDGLNYTGYYTPKENQYISLESIMKYIKKHFDYIPQKHISIGQFGSQKRIIIERGNHKISIGTSFILSHNESTKEKEIRNMKIVYDYMKINQGGRGSSLDSWESLSRSLDMDLPKMGIIPTETQLSIFDL